jgi:hypothetical protein
MPITINGSGTVTGISAGGLPDGVITTDDIAAAAITRAKIGYAGAILQVVNATYSTQTTSSSSTYADTGLSASITPSSSSSKVLVIVHQGGCAKRNGNSASRINIQLLRGSTSLIEFAKDAGFTNVDGYNHIGVLSTAYLDSPATTSSTTYKTQFQNVANAAEVRVQDNSSVSSIILMEVAA